MSRISRTVVLATLATTCAQRSSLDPSVIDEPRILAVRAEPPEAIPGSTRVSFEALVASPEGEVRDAHLAWAWCNALRVPTDTTTIPARCTGLDAPWVPVDANGILAIGVVPADACTTVGPNPAPIGPDALAARAPDPDATGGYSIPLRIALDDSRGVDLAFAPMRITCARRDVPTDVVAEFAREHRPNSNPNVERIDRVGDGLEVVATAGSAESYARISVDGERVEHDVERLEVSWFVVGGRFEWQRTVMDSQRSRNRLIVESSNGAVSVWVVVRDGRGGLGWGSARW